MCVYARVGVYIREGGYVCTREWVYIYIIINVYIPSSRVGGCIREGDEVAVGVGVAQPHRDPPRERERDSECMVLPNQALFRPKDELCLTT